MSNQARLPRIACPHCRSRAIVRDSEQLTPLVRELRLACTNYDCGHRFVASLEIFRSVAPSACPDPSIHLPVGALPRRAANENYPLPANDVSGPEVPLPVPAAENDAALPPARTA